MLIDEMVERLDMAEHRIRGGWTTGARHDSRDRYCLVGAIEIERHEKSPVIHLLHAELYRTIYGSTPLTTLASEIEPSVWGWNDLQISSEPVLLVICETRERIRGGLGAPVYENIETRAIEVIGLRKKYPKISALDLRHVKPEPVKSYISELRETDLAIAGD